MAPKGGGEEQKLHSFRGRMDLWVYTRHLGRQEGVQTKKVVTDAGLRSLVEKRESQTVLRFVKEFIGGREATGKYVTNRDIKWDLGGGQLGGT